jgi:LemA protein
MMIFVLLLLVAALAVWAMFAFNRLVRLRNQVRTAWADIDVQLQRRHDLVPSLVAAVQAYAGHESATLKAVSELRAQALAQTQPARLGEVEASLERELGRLIALKESYPDLKANRNFAQLQQELVQVEDQLQYARRFYNGAVRDLNDGTQRVPDAFVARAFGFKGAEFFQAEAGSRDAVKVEMAK